MGINIHKDILHSIDLNDVSNKFVIATRPKEKFLWESLENHIFTSELFCFVGICNAFIKILFNHLL